LAPVPTTKSVILSPDAVVTSAFETIRPRMK
jgi:hypothetical protein